MMDGLDASAYLERISYTGGTTPAVDVLAGLQRHHTEAIPFENLAMLLGEPVPLDLPAWSPANATRCAAANTQFIAQASRANTID